MKKVYLIAASLIVLALLYACSLYNFLLFHFIAEVFSIIIACGIFMVAWNSRRYFDNQYLLFIGIAYLFVGILDLLHVLSYKGMNILVGYDANTPTQLWISARYLESLSLLAAPLMLRRRIRTGFFVIGYSLIVIFILLSILYWRDFPDCFLADAGGLTPFKINSEYIICLLFLASGILLFRFRKNFDPTVLKWLLASIGITILSELAFTTYASVYGPSNLLGHFLKIVSFYCIYIAIIETGLTKPYDLLFRNLNQSKERYHSLFIHMLDGFARHEMVYDRNGKPVDYVFLEVNKAFEEMTGLTDVVGKRVTDVIPGIEKDPVDWIGTYGAVATGGDAVRFENYSEVLEKWYSVTAYCPGKDQFVAIFEDISQRKKDQENLNQQRKWLSVILRSIGDAVIATDSDGRISFLNPVAATLTGWSIKEALDQPIDTVFRIIHEQTKQPVEDIVKKVLSSGSVVALANHTALLTRDNREIPIEDSAAPIRNAGGDVIGVVLVFYDVTAKRNAQNNLRKSEARFKLLSSTASRLLATKDPQGLVEDICRDVMEHVDCQTFFNFLVDESSGRLHLNAFAGIPESEAAKIQWLDFGVTVCGYVALDKQSIIAEDISNTSDLRTELIKSYGVQAYCCHPLMIEDRLIGTLSFGSRTRPRFTSDEIDVMFNISNKVAIAIQRIQTQETLRNSKEALEQMVVKRTNALARTVNILEAEIERRKLAEDDLMRVNEQLANRADQLRALAGELTMAEQRERKRMANVLHDGLQQYLAIAKLQLNSLCCRVEDDGLKKTMEEIEAVIAESIQVSRSLSAELSPPVLYERGLSAGLQWLGRWMEEKHGFSVDLGIETIEKPAEDVSILVFESVRELLFNAVKHAGVSSARVRMDQKDKNRIQIVVSDRGAGFDVSKMSTGVNHSGGFGLFSIRERIALIGGRFEIESTPGNGSRFTLIVPAARPSDKTAHAERHHPVVVSCRREFESQNQLSPIRVLIADDHTLFRDGLARLVDLEPDIRVVGQASNGREVIELVHKVQPEIILMDINMPDIDGIKATRMILKESQQVRIIGLSMHEEEESARAFTEAGGVMFKNKGCQAAELISAIRTCGRMEGQTPASDSESMS